MTQAHSISTGAYTRMDNINVGERLKAVRHALNMTQAEFANALDVSTGAYQGYERGEREVPSSLLRNLYHLVGTDPLWVIDAQDGIEPHTRRADRMTNALIAAGVAVERIITGRRSAGWGPEITDAVKYRIVAAVMADTLRTGMVDHDQIRTLVGFAVCYEDNEAAALAALSGSASDHAPLARTDDEAATP